MPTRYPRIPNVKSTSLFNRSLPLRSLVQVTASEPLFIPPTTLNIPAAFFTSKTNSLAGSHITTNAQFYKRIASDMHTDILPVDSQKLGDITFKESKDDLIDDWSIHYAEGKAYESLKRAADEVVNTDTPVAFPTETVYGLGADATRSSAVKAIFAAKGRPADNPLIVHVHSLPQLRALLSGKQETSEETLRVEKDPIPEIYKPLIERFWPGPITIILPAPGRSTLAPEVTAGLPTFGARMPRSILALALLRLCGRPLAAPSANASTRPSPTAAEHVYDDLQGRIHTIVDGGPCEVGVESTVVDGLSSPPTILRPGGVTVEQLRQCPGWENVVIGYKDQQEGGASKPRAPGMKYRHYSPKAEVILFEAGAGRPGIEETDTKKTIGIIRTKNWEPALGLNIERNKAAGRNGHANGISQYANTSTPAITPSRLSNLLRSVAQHQIPHAEHYTSSCSDIWDIGLGAETEGVARGLFSALRELDKKGVETIYVEGISDKAGDDIAAAVMNRLRKAAEIRT
ncbi:translation factor [Cucurbitaria berberidis CBS 394.84]|uniref:Threonylcarbamoyl-AMP synthase n=1 Tax=Cucurbitaria berberidis CBS 394.84 TaxID=1168544 RepID=A0A9P4GN27_9PLEO|nr:translation factor [Cucurbitaria berberidis CBS 394.84]KAF1848444.1 translation factor [Cucurbitaria berberidis CBS 394.84]